MGDSSQLSADYVVAFVHASEQDVAEVNRPDPIVHFLETHWVLLKRIREEEQPLPQPNRPGIGDALDEEMAACRCRAEAMDGTARPAVDPAAPREVARHCRCDGTH
jgi:hypothetical protein